MNIFNAAITGLMIVIKKIGIGFKAVMTGLKIAITSTIDFIASVITAIINAIVSSIKWIVAQIVNFIHFLFRTYLRLEAGCVPPVQKLVGLMIRMRCGFVILSILYAVYKYFGIKYLLISIFICAVLVFIGYSEAENEEKKFDAVICGINKIISNYLKYVIRSLFIVISIISMYKAAIIPVKITSILHEKVSTSLTVRNYYIKCHLSFYGYGDFDGDGEEDIAIGAKFDFNKEIRKTYVLFGPLFNKYFVIDENYPFKIIKNAKVRAENFVVIEKDVIYMTNLIGDSFIMYWDGDKFLKSSLSLE